MYSGVLDKCREPSVARLYQDSVNVATKYRAEPSEAHRAPLTKQISKEMTQIRRPLDASICN